jgi:DNA-binding NtrC family response regulator
MRQLNILIIDDNRDMADGLGMILEHEGYQVTLAYNGHDGINAFNCGRFDMALIDIRMPDMNGFEVLQKIHKQNPNVGVFMITGYRIEQMLSEIVDDGDVEVLRSPYEDGHLLEILDREQSETIILVDDDDPACGERLSACLSGHGMQALLARNCREAIDGVLSGPVEVLVLDMRMPIIYGLAVYTELKQRGRIVKTIIIAGCPHGDSDSVDSLRSTSVTGCLFKPFRPESMLRAIADMKKRQAGVNR